jgi:hypothetical protein
MSKMPPVLPELRLTPDEWVEMAVADALYEPSDAEAATTRQGRALAAEGVFQQALADLAEQHARRLVRRLHCWLPVSELEETPVGGPPPIFWWVYKRRSRT